LVKFQFDAQPPSGLFKEVVLPSSRSEILQAPCGYLSVTADTIAVSNAAEAKIT
jgi:hypothetical protein